jgi:hypothetical protein
VCSVQALLPSRWEEFSFPQEELHEGSSTSDDPSHVPQDDRERYLIAQSELNDVVRDVILPKQQA